MFRSVIRGTVQFFDTSLSGRILNRFSKDMDESMLGKHFFFVEILLKIIVVLFSKSYHNSSLFKQMSNISIYIAI